MSGTGFISWTQADITNFLEANPGQPGNLKQNFLTDPYVDRLHPYKAIPWTNDNVALYGIGVMQPGLVGWPPSNTSTSFQTPTNYFNYQFWQNVIQQALQIPNIGDSTKYPLVSDGLFRNPCLNGMNATSCPGWLGRVSLVDYVLDMLAPSYSSAVTNASIPWGINNGPFNPDRLLARYDQPGLGPQPLPLQQYLNNNKYIGVFPIIPPFGYVTVGEYYLSNFALGNAYNPNNSSDLNYNYSPTNLLFCKKDQRFVQPALNLPIWPSISFPSTMTIRAGGVSSITIQIPNTTNTSYSPATYAYTSIGNLIFNTLTSVGNNYNFDSYPIQCPWNVNINLIRFFPNGPNGLQTFFSNVSKIRTIFPDINTGGSSPSVTPQGKIVNPLYHASYVYPTSGGNTPLNLAFSPTNLPSQATVFPVLIPAGLYTLLTCCTGQYNLSDLVWTWSAFTPFPSGVTDASLDRSVAICLAGDNTFYYKPTPTACDLLTQNYCNNSLANTGQFAGPNCACQNTDVMLSNAGLPVPPDPNDSSLAAVEQNLISNIDCYYTLCSGRTEALKLSGQRPINGQQCPANITCIITGNTFETTGNVELINNCGEGSPPRGSAQRNLNIQALLFVAAGLFVVVAIVILLLKVRSRKKEKQLASYDTAESNFDPEDFDEDLDEDFSKSFPPPKKKSSTVKT